jgi:uncharacterized membrane protein YeaQ/YmgE (transglycosylase-associated protein family)
MTLIDIIGWIVIGLLVGLLARFLVPGRDPMGCLATSLLGIVGSIVGGFISRFFFRPAPAVGYVRPGFLISLVGAILVLLLVRAVRGRSTP